MTYLYHVKNEFGIAQFNLIAYISRVKVCLANVGFLQMKNRCIPNKKELNSWLF